MHTVVIVDDEHLIIEDLKVVFPWKKYGFGIVRTFTSATQALEYITNYPPTVVMCDIKMPKITGIELMLKLRSIGNTSLFVIVSGFSDFSYAQQAIRCGANDYIVKPVSELEGERLLIQLKVKLDGEACATYLPANEVNNDVFQRILDDLNRVKVTEMTLGEVANRHFITKNYLCILFKKHLNTTFSTYVNKIKIEHASARIRDGCHTLENIAQDLGYCDYFYFSKVFKKHMGLSPKSYQKYCMGKNYEKDH